MPKARQTIKMKVHKGTVEIPSLQTSVSSSGKGKASAKTTVKAKIHKK